uniref:Eukaryotic translation initiation factor 2A n=1 Tax=Angiostrongylus cantonensis TaxID=6313 RepID=A0A0K0DNA1_ANGCA
MGDNLVYAVRGSSGLALRRGLGPDSTTIFEDKENPKENPCSAFQFSNDGRIFAYCDGRKTRAFEIASGREIVNVELRRTKHILFSPRDTHMITYEPYAIYGQKVSADQKPEPNLHVYSIADGSCITTVVATKEATWMPQFSDDESVAVRLVGSELLLHKGCQFDHYDQKIIVPNTKSSPGRVQVRTLNPPFALITAKNFFRSDRAILQWNSKGRCKNPVIVTTL